MLTNFEIERICEKLDLPIVGVYSKNELYNIPRKVGSYYINLMDDNVVDGEGNNGSHWVFFKIYCDEDRDEAEEEDGHKLCNALYFDSFGFGMPKAVSNFLKPFKPVYCSTREIQNIDSSQCGFYCIACDWVLEHKQDGETYVEDYEKFLNMWNDDVKKNLNILKNIFRKIWKEDESIHDEKKIQKLTY